MFAIGSDKKAETARLLNILIAGERVAAVVSTQQAKFARGQSSKSSSKYQRFFRTQSRQEHFHAAFIRAGKLAICPKDVRAGAEVVFCERLQSELMASLQRGCLHESVLGLQIVVETMGELLLADLDKEMENRGLGLRRMRRLILHQEMAHHGFGERYFRRRVDNTAKQELQQRASRYVDISFELLRDVNTLFETFAVDRTLYEHAILDNLDEVLLQH